LFVGKTGGYSKKNPKKMIETPHCWKERMTSQQRSNGKRTRVAGEKNVFEEMDGAQIAKGCTAAAQDACEEVVKKNFHSGGRDHKTLREIEGPMLHMRDKA